ncbi:MAG: 3-hydroxyacyl-ACP dehydratase FabZ [Gammaproteobacteria bacterium]|nr:3-hydroxyacyl-ACP dehydratase FabZ [Gammaproteobacteria bacterium]
MSKLEVNEILSLLPHRYPFILIDRVEEFQVDQSIIAIKNVTINELFFTGHFPNNPVMPGVLQLEAMAQAFALLAFKSLQSKGGIVTGKEIFYFAGIDKARFKKPVIPGDQLLIEILLTRQKGAIWKAKGTVKVDGELVCSAELTAAHMGSKQ